MKTMLKRLALIPPLVMAATSSLALEGSGEKHASHGAAVFDRPYLAPGLAAAPKAAAGSLSLKYAENAVSQTTGERSPLAHLINLREAMIFTVDRSAALATGIPGLPPEVATAWEKAVRATYEPDEMMSDAITVFAQYMTREAENQVIAFFWSPVGQRLRAARQAFWKTSAEALDTLLDREQALARSNPHLHKLYFDLGVAIQGDPDFAETRLLLHALMTGSDGHIQTDEDIEAFVAAARNPHPRRRTVHAMRLLPDASESDLQAIVDFFHSGAGQQLARAEVAMYPAVIKAGLPELSTRLSELLKGPGKGKVDP